MIERPEGIVKELAAGIALWGIFVEMIVLIFTKERIFYTSGLLIGLAAGCLLTLHMKRSLEYALDFDEKGATRHIQKGTAIRSVCLFALFYLIFRFQIGSIVTAFIGVMGLKISAYLQPHIHQWFQKRH